MTDLFLADGLALFDRQYKLTVGTVETSELRVQFKIRKTLKPEPNTASFVVTNLGQDNRDVLSHAREGKLPVRFEAGYESTGSSQLFTGSVRRAFSTWQGPDCETTFATDDSADKLRSARLSMTIGRGVPVDAVLRALVRALGVGEGNVEHAVGLLLDAAPGVAGMFGPGTVLSGNVARELTDFCRSVGLEWSVQDGVLLILKLGQPYGKLGIKLSSSSGLEGSPTVDFEPATRTHPGRILVNAACRLIPGLAPGAAIVLEAREVQGAYRIEDIEYVGDSHGSDWSANLVLASY